MAKVMEVVKKDFLGEEEKIEKKNTSKKGEKVVFYNSPKTNRKAKGRKGRPCGFRG